MKGYKGFHEGLVCKGKQYAENTVFEEKEANICKNGMHFCPNPLDVLEHYPLIDKNGELNEFAEVEALDEVYTNDDKKYCTKKLKIGAKLDIAGFAKASFDFLKERIKKETAFENDDAKQVGGDSAQQVGGDSAQQVGGNWAQQVGGNWAQQVGGDWAQQVGGDDAQQVGGDSAKQVGGDDAKQVGGDSAKQVGGNWAKQVGGNSAQQVGGNWAKQVGGNWAKQVGGNWAKQVGGNWAKQVGGNWAKQVGGNWAKQVGGNWAQQQSGEHSIMVSENESIAKGGIGSVIVMVKRNNKGEIISYKAIQIDGEKYKPNTWYTLKNGEMVEVEDE